MIGRWLVTAILVAVMTAGFYLFNAFHMERGKAAPQYVPTSTSAVPVQEKTNEERYYTMLSQAAEYIVYGRVSDTLAQTERTIRPVGSSLVIKTYDNNFLIDVIQSATAQGARSKQGPLQSRIIIREGTTSHSARFTVGETFIAFLKNDPSTSTYYVVSLSAGSFEGKLPVVVKDGQPHIASGQTVSQFLEVFGNVP